MIEKLHVLFTLDCPTAGPHAPPYGPAGWGASALAIDAFCTAVLRAGFLPTIFVTPETAHQHGPMCEDLAASGVEVGLLVEPPALRGAGLKQQLGAYGADEQEAIVGESRRRVEEAIGRRLLSVRSAYYSASDDTFAVLSRVGFRQASLSSPGRRIPKHHADWEGAATEPHFASRTSRLAAGDLPLLEVPVTTDSTQRTGGIAPDLAIERGTVDRWHAPLIAGQLARQEETGAAFRTLSFVSSTNCPFGDTSTRQRQTLDALMAHLDDLEPRYEILPATLASCYVYFRQTLDE